MVLSLFSSSTTFLAMVWLSFLSTLHSSINLQFSLWILWICSFFCCSNFLCRSTTVCNFLSSQSLCRFNSSYTGRAAFSAFCWSPEAMGGALSGECFRKSVANLWARSKESRWCASMNVKSAKMPSSLYLSERTLYALISSWECNALALRSFSALSFSSFCLSSVAFTIS